MQWQLAVGSWYSKIIAKMTIKHKSQASSITLSGIRIILVIIQRANSITTDLFTIVNKVCEIAIADCFGDGNRIELALVV